MKIPNSSQPSVAISHALRPSLRVACVTSCSLLLWAACFGLYTRHYDVLPARYHPDEPGKAAQIIEDDRNFNHPLLMLEVTQWAVAWSDTPREEEAVTQVGRLVIAGMAATAIVAFALIGFTLRRWPGFIGVGIVAALCPPWIMYAHYFKEDPALVMGLAVSLLGLTWFWRGRCTPALVLAGIGCGLAVSGKYVGLIALPWVLLWSLPPSRKGIWWHRLTRWPIVVLWAVLVTLLINWRALGDFDHFWRAMGNEAEHGVTAHSGVMGFRPNWYWATAVWYDLTWPVITLAGWYALRLTWLCSRTARRCVARRGSRVLGQGISLGGELSLALFAVAYFVMMLYSPLPFNRYILPVTMLVYVLAGLGAADLATTVAGLRWRGSRRATPASDDQDPSPLSHQRPWVQRVALSLTLLAVLMVHVPLTLDYLSQFPQDSRLRLQRWLLANLPPNSRLLQDYYAGLPHWSFRNPSPDRTRLWIVPTGFMAAEYGDFDNLRRRRINYVVVADVAYGRYLTPWLQAEPGHEASFIQRRAFYERLFHEGELVWDSRNDLPLHPSRTWTSPLLRVYRVPRE